MRLYDPSTKHRSSSIRARSGGASGTCKSIVTTRMPAGAGTGPTWLSHRCTTLPRQPSQKHCPTMQRPCLPICAQSSEQSSGLQMSRAFACAALPTGWPVAHASRAPNDSVPMNTAADTRMAVLAIFFRISPSSVKGYSTSACPRPHSSNTTARQHAASLDREHGRLASCLQERIDRSLRGDETECAEGVTPVQSEHRCHRHGSCAVEVPHSTVGHRDDREADPVFSHKFASRVR